MSKAEIQKSGGPFEDRERNVGKYFLWSAGSWWVLAN